jgi:hypothetical protein
MSGASITERIVANTYTVEVAGQINLTTTSGDRAAKRYLKKGGAARGVVVKCNGTQLTAEQVGELED